MVLMIAQLLWIHQNGLTVHLKRVPLVVGNGYCNEVD